MTHDLKRLTDSRARFAAEMDRQRRISFAWGGHDCLLGLVSGAVEALTGEPFAVQYHGRYSTEEEAAAVIEGEGFGDLGDLMASLLPEHEHPSRARVGDVGVIRAAGALGMALCIVDASSLIVLTARGHGRAPRELMLRAYRVGLE
jgi:hypothetical protein